MKSVSIAVGVVALGFALLTIGCEEDNSTEYHIEGDAQIGSDGSIMNAKTNAPSE